jgi:hypothetical protein
VLAAKRRIVRGVRRGSHRTQVITRGEGRTQATCACGWSSKQFGSDKALGNMDALQLAKDAADLHEWEASPSASQR